MDASERRDDGKWREKWGSDEPVNSGTRFCSVEEELWA